MKIREDNFRTTEFLGIKESGLFAIGDKYYVRLEHSCDLASGQEVNAVKLDDGMLIGIDAYTKVRDLSGCALVVEANKVGG